MIFMKHVTLLIIISLFSPVSYAKKIIFLFDPMQSYMAWQVTHSGIKTAAGKWSIIGNIVVDEEKKGLQVTLNINHPISGIPQSNKDVQKPLFDYLSFPTSTFTSDKIDLKSIGSGHLQGKLSLHGFTRPVVWKILLKPADKTHSVAKTPIRFTATTQIKGSDFGMKTLLPDVGDEVSIEVEGEVYPQKHL